MSDLSLQHDFFQTYNRFTGEWGEYVCANCDCQQSMAEGYECLPMEPFESPFDVVALFLEAYNA